MGRRTRDRMDMGGTDRHGDQRAGNGVLCGLDSHMVKDGDLMGVVIAILVIAVIVWFPWKKGGE